MKESVARSYEIEEAKGGLVVRKALYGRLIGGSRWCAYSVLFLVQLIPYTYVYSKVSVRSTKVQFQC